MGNTLELYDCSSYTSSSLLLQPQLCMALNSMVVARSGYETLAVKPGISTPVMPFIWFTWFNSYGKLALSQVTFYIKDARLLRRPESCMLRNNEWTYQVKMFDGLRPAAPESSFFFYQWASLGTFAYFASAYSAAAFCFFSARDGWESATWSVNAISLLWRHEKKQKTLLIGTAVAPLFLYGNLGACFLKLSACTINFV